MKKSNILAIVVIAVAIVVITSTAGDASTYVNFQEAKEIAEVDEEKKIHVVGTLKKDMTGNVSGMEISPDKMTFRFTMLDENNFEQQVLHINPVPTDFERSEQVVVVGSYKENVFVADKILLKCPSKYQEEELKV